MERPAADFLVAPFLSGKYSYHAPEGCRVRKPVRKRRPLSTSHEMAIVIFPAIPLAIDMITSFLMPIGGRYGMEMMTESDVMRIAVSMLSSRSVHEKGHLNPANVHELEQLPVAM